MERKSVPVYALDGSALSGLDSIRLTGAGAIDALVAELGLEQEKGRFLFRSGDMAMDSEGYDSVLVGNLLLALLEKLTREAQEARHGEGGGAGGGEEAAWPARPTGSSGTSSATSPRRASSGS